MYRLIASTIMDASMKCYLNYNESEEITYNPDFNPSQPISDNNLPF